jgi:SP family xylose:H+ symportor-like MFS transporter
MSILAALFMWGIVPETKGRSLEQMQTLWQAAGKKSLLAK